MLTFLPLEQIQEMEHWEGSELNKAKEILAYELTALVHGEEEAKKALEQRRISSVAEIQRICQLLKSQQISSMMDRQI